MIQVGNLAQLPTLLQDVYEQKKTGKIVIISNYQEEIYIYQGQVATIISEQDVTPLLLKLQSAGLVSLDQLQDIPMDTIQFVSQTHGSGQYNEVQIAQVLVKAGLLDYKQLIDWARQELKKQLERVLSLPEGRMYFEEGILPPSHRLSILSETRALFDVSGDFASKSANEAKILPTFPSSSQPLLFKKSVPVKKETTLPKPATPSPSTPLPGLSLPSIQKRSRLSKEEMMVPLTPVGFAKVPETTGKNLVSAITQVGLAVVQQTLHVTHFFDDVETVRVAKQKKPNPLFTWEAMLIVVILIIAGLAHGINMSHFPYYEDDEGTYLSQAWAVVHLGKLAYYTYWYDHAPMGWIQIAIWEFLTGGFRTFGSAMISGRILMLLFQLGSTFVLYRITRSISKSIIIAVVVTLLFALSPYGLYYHRRVLLDNIMTFWMLLSILLLLAPAVSLKRVWLSATALAISILSKEVTVFIIPVLAYLVWVRADKLHRKIAFCGWVVIISIIISGYPLLAIIKGELFPTGTLLGGGNPHVSLIGTLLYQGSRGKDEGIFSFQSNFWYRTIIWIHDEPILVIAGSSCAIMSLLLIKTHKLISIMGMITLLLWMFLARGGVVLDFYLIPLIPMLSLSLGLMLGVMAQWAYKYLNRLIQTNILRSNIVQLIVVVLFFISVVPFIPPSTSGYGYGATNIGSPSDPFIDWNGHQADAQVQAISWIESHISIKSRIIIDMYMWPELYDRGYKNVHYYWKLETDPAIRDGIFHNNWRNIDYLVTTPQMLVDMQDANMTIVKALIENSSTVAQFDTGKWRVDIRKVRK